MFEFHAIFALNRYLNPLWQALSGGGIYRNLDHGAERLILIVDSRATQLLRFCVLNSLVMTGFQYRCVVYTDSDSIRDMCALFSDIKDFVEVVDLAAIGFAIKLSLQSYNKLLKCSQFWDKVQASSVLVTQPDALMIEPLPDEFFKYDYIGAPWSSNKFLSVSFPQYTSGELRKFHDLWLNLVKNPNMDLDIRVGNGGHSIRSVGFMVAVSSEKVSADNEQEDIFYAKNIDCYNGCFPSVSEAKRFACETSYSFAYGAHASYLHLEACYQSEIYERHIKHLAGLYDANCA